MSAAAAWLGVAVALIAAAGCGADERGDRSVRVAQECNHHIDVLINDGLVPRSDRDYATEMCLRQR